MGGQGLHAVFLANGLQRPPLKLIGFSAETFAELERDSEKFASWLDSSNSPAEIMAVLEPALRKRPHAEPHERDVLRQLLPKM